jgi:D-alanyl-D-alanine carboxypeptidase/D-alanyl-D-alanine-endopeptidase (penicillin-binding protein 4)
MRLERACLGERSRIAGVFPTTRRWGLALALAALAAALAPASAAAGLAEVQADFRGELTLAGPESSAYVYDLTAKATLVSERATVLRRPASVEKLYTASTALELLGPEARLQTSVLGVGTLLADGTWEGSLYLRGGGDPTFGSSAFIHSHYGGIGTSVGALAAQLARRDHIRRVTGAIYGDESLFDSLRGEPSSGYAPDPFLEGSLGALSFDRGIRGRLRGAHAQATYAAARLIASLHADGVSVRGGASAAITPAGAVELAQAQSPRLSQLLALTLPPSDNFFAETLLKGLGARSGGAGTTAAGAMVVRRTLAALAGIHPHVVDGSGLSNSDRTSPYEVVQLLATLAPTPIGAVLREDLAVAGQSGTLKRRMRGTAAAGRCRAKTGTLTGASNLAGFCTSANGHALAFAIFNDAIPVAFAHTIQDHLAITLARSSIEP